MDHLRYTKIHTLGQRRPRHRTRIDRVSAIRKRRRDTSLNWLSIVGKGLITVLPLALSFTPISSLKWLSFGPLKLIRGLTRYIPKIGW